MEPWAAPNREYAPPKPGEPSLHRAARLGEHAEIERLIADGADINLAYDMALDPAARSTLANPLMVAAGSGDGATLETLRLLVKLGADPQAIWSNQSAATFAARGLGWNYRPGGDAERLRFLLELGVPVAGNDKMANRAIGDTAAAGDFERLKLLVEAGCDVNGYHRNGKSTRPFDLHRFEIPWLMAAQSGNVDCVRYLIDNGANVDARDSREETALFAAGSLGVTRMLVEAGVPLEAVNWLGETALTNAVTEGLEAMERIKGLIEAGANVNATHRHGYTVYMSAVSSPARDIEILKLLIQSGADPHAVTPNGYNAFQEAIAFERGDEAEDVTRSILSYLKELGVDMNLRNELGQTTFERAMEEGTEIEQKILRELGAEDGS